jgi:hypothetical protein
VAILLQPFTNYKSSRLKLILGIRLISMLLAKQACCNDDIETWTDVIGTLLRRFNARRFPLQPVKDGLNHQEER